MKKTLLQACALCVGATAVQAGGLDRSGQGINLIFEEGSVVQFRLGYTDPDVTGTLGGGASGNVANDFTTPHLGYKRALTEKLDFALIYDQPFGADVDYAAPYLLSQNPIPGGRTDVLRAKADADALTAMFRYKLDGGFSVLAGVRAQRLDANVAVPAAAGYAVDAESGTDFGYLVGVAWEKPEIAARVALTYNSKITHDLSQTESLNPPPIPPIPPGTVASFNTSSEVVTPQSVNLDFQTGVAPKTLVFGSIRWVDWPQTVYAPPNYPANPLVDYNDATWSYSLGMGYQFSEQFSGAVTLGYESSSDSPVSNLGPTDGFWSIGLGGTYSIEKATISGGVRYTDLGDATTTSGAVFTDNSAWSVGIQVTYALN